LTIKAITHNIISAGSILADNYWMLYGAIVYNICTMISLHVLFNCKIESYLPQFYYRYQVVPSSRRNIPMQSSAGQRQSSDRIFSAGLLIDENHCSNNRLKPNISIIKLSMVSSQSRLDRNSTIQNPSRLGSMLGTKKATDVPTQRGDESNQLHHHVNLIKVKPRKDIYAPEENRYLE